MELKLLAATYISSTRRTRVICIRTRQNICLICMETGYKETPQKRPFWRFKSLIRLSSHFPKALSHVSKNYE